jgi:hypothetical protein
MKVKDPNHQGFTAGYADTIYDFRIAVSVDLRLLP